MDKTYNVDEAVQAQKEYRKEYAAKHPEDWASSFMKEGKGFAPINGRCYCCGKQIYAEGGISVERARTELTTGCPFCHRSFVD